MRLADRIAANNLYLDSAKDRRRRELEALREKHGSCRADGPFVAENALRGAWVMPCERGALRVDDHARADRAAEGPVPRGAVAGDSDGTDPGAGILHRVGARTP